MLIAVTAWSCIGEEDIMIAGEEGIERATVILTVPSYSTKASVPDEERIRDMNLMIFEDGKAEEIIWRRGIAAGDDIRFEVTLVKGRRYTIAAAANLGRRLDFEDVGDWEGITAELKSSRGFTNGIPMTAIAEDIVPGEGKDIRMELVRTVAKISVKIDRSRLSEDVQMRVTSMRIGNFPRRASLWKESRAASGYDVFGTGFELTARQCQPLNDSGYGSVSGEVSAYMLENMQGDSLNEGATSFMELEIDYKSAELISYDSPLVYRFYLGERQGNFDVERNCHYRFTIIPENDGLSGEGWRVDKSGIGPSEPVFSMHPGDYAEGSVGDSLRIWCECYPRTAPFDPGLEELDYDRSRGIYDYKVDDDMHGVTLYLKKAGTGIVYMSAGDPINRSGMVFVRVNP